MPVISVSTDANLDMSMPLAHEYVAWSSRPVKVVVTVTPGESIASFVQTSGLPMDFNFVEDSPGSGVWTSFFDTVTNGTNWPVGTTTNCFQVTATTGGATNLCFDVQCAPNPYNEVVLTVNGAPQAGTFSANTNGFGINSLNGSCIITVAANDVITLMNSAPDDMVIPNGQGNVTMTIQKLD